MDNPNRSTNPLRAKLTLPHASALPEGLTPADSDEEVVPPTSSQRTPASPILRAEELDALAASFDIPADPEATFALRRKPTPAQPSHSPPSESVLKTGMDPAIEAELNRLKAENEELHRVILEMKPLLQEASEMEIQYQNKIEELQAALDEKTKQFNELHEQLQALEEQIAGTSTGAFPAPAAPSPPKTRTELEEWADELEKEAAKLQQERRRLEQERQQLREDEQELEAQMRKQEVQLARDRAMLAQKELEVRRTLEQIQREIELMSSGDAVLRSKLDGLRGHVVRRQQELRGGGPMPPTGGVIPTPQPQPPSGLGAAPKPTAGDSGIIKKIWGRDPSK